MFTSRAPRFQSQRQSRDDEDYVIGGPRQALIGEALQITERASYRVLRHEAAADLVADDDDIARRHKVFSAPPHGIDEIMNLRNDQPLLFSSRLLPELSFSLREPGFYQGNQS
jgi:hypothetical protein